MFGATSSNQLILTSLLSEALSQASALRPSSSAASLTALPALSATASSLEGQGAVHSADQGACQSAIQSAKVLSQIVQSASTVPFTSHDASFLTNWSATSLSQDLNSFSQISNDIICLSNDTSGVHLTDDLSSEGCASVDVTEVDQPLDLSTKPRWTPEPPSSSGTVIQSSLSTKGVGVKRSTSSVCYRSTPEPDVSEHFRRSLSGKWPRRHVTSKSNYSEFDVTSSRKTSTSSTPTGIRSPMSGRRTPSRVSQITIKEGDVEDHFKKALGEETFHRLKLGQTGR